MKQYDVYGIGNALVDMEFEVHDQFFLSQKIDKGLMTLVDEKRQNELLEALGTAPLKQQCGGSAANTMIAVSQLGGKSFYSCKVARDPIGNFYFQDLLEQGVDSNLKTQEREEGVTGKCLVMVTKDAERTMNTFLGITSTLSKHEVVPEGIKNAKYLYIEGYLVASPTGKDAAVHARKLAQVHGVKTSLTFSDVNMVNFFRESLLEIIGDGLDLIFCNEIEAQAFTGETDEAKIIQKLKLVAKTFVMTLGERGAIVFDGKEILRLGAQKIKPVDSNGAGDMYAGAFLYAITNGASFEKAGELAGIAAAKVVSQYGPRLKKDEVLTIKHKVLG